LPSLTETISSSLAAAAATSIGYCDPLNDTLGSLACSGADSAMYRVMVVVATPFVKLRTVLAPKSCGMPTLSKTVGTSPFIDVLAPEKTRVWSPV
jgi:hypothetical protein